MAKKNWIYIKRGLSEDPKHRASMGECIWLYMHIIDRADWETGIVYDWKDGQEAADMGLSIDTIRRQRQKLEDGDYIRCSQKQYKQEITIMEWRNPRDYGCEVKNPRIQGSNEPLPSDFQGSGHGLNYDTRQVKTPTSNSLSKSLMPIEWYVLHGEEVPPELIDKNKLEQDAIGSFESSLGFGKLPFDSTPEWQKFKKWVIDVYQTNHNEWESFSAWRKSNGKYNAMSNKQIRMNPSVFMDTGYPEYKAHSAMYKKDEEPLRML